MFIIVFSAYMYTNICNVWYDATWSTTGMTATSQLAALAFQTAKSLSLKISLIYGLFKPLLKIFALSTLFPLPVFLTETIVTNHLLVFQTVHLLNHCYYLLVLQTVHCYQPLTFV